MDVRGLDDYSCRKVIGNLEKSRYVTAILIEKCSEFEQNLNLELEYQRRRDEHITKQKKEETQSSLIAKMMKRKLYRPNQIPPTKESKIDIARLTDNFLIKKQKVDTGIGQKMKS